ncbi:MAG: hypothetical protein FJ100_24005 [Deltaproteobacteria bacterium]|nr:hypothetical protein [Deltaproteobacteria bacterium]
MIEVKVRLSKKVQADPALLQRVQRPLALAQGLANHLAVRVAEQGRLATPAKEYKAKSRGYVVSKAYAQSVGVAKTSWRSSAAFHAAAGTKFGSFRVSGGLWRGLRVRNYGTSEAVVDFGGSSLGSNPATERGKTKGGKERSRPVRVRNDTKGGTVFRQSKVNVVQPTDAEQSAMVAAVARWTQNAMVRVLGAEPGLFWPDGDKQLLQRILQIHDGSR